MLELAHHLPFQIHMYIDLSFLIHLYFSLSNHLYIHLICICYSFLPQTQMDSKWPLKKARDFDLNIAENEPLDDDMHLGFNGTTNISQSHSNPSQVPITQNHYQNVDASYSQV